MATVVVAGVTPRRATAPRATGRRVTGRRVTAPRVTAPRARVPRATALDEIAEHRASGASRAPDAFVGVNQKRRTHDLGTTPDAPRLGRQPAADGRWRLPRRQAAIHRSVLPVPRRRALHRRATRRRHAARSRAATDRSALRGDAAAGDARRVHPQARRAGT